MHLNIKVKKNVEVFFRILVIKSPDQTKTVY